MAPGRLAHRYTRVSDLSSQSSKPPERPDDPDSRPTVAVALKHQPETANAPKVVATGQGAVAEQILQIAFANGVKVRQDPDLTALLAAVDNDSEIPIAAFAAVAQILAYVYRANADAEPPINDWRTP